MTTYNIFYDSNKSIVWSTTADISDGIKTAQSDLGYSHVALDIADDIQPDDNYYLNSDATALVEKSIFDFTFSNTTPALDEVVNVTGLPSGTRVFIDGVSKATMDDTTLTLTIQECGIYKVVFSKLHYKKHSGTKLIIKRYGE